MRRIRKARADEQRQREDPASQDGEPGVLHAAGEADPGRLELADQPGIVHARGDEAVGAGRPASALSIFSFGRTPSSPSVASVPVMLSRSRTRSLTFPLLHERLELAVGEGLRPGRPDEELGEQQCQRDRREIPERESSLRVLHPVPLSVPSEASLVPEKTKAQELCSPLPKNGPRPAPPRRRSVRHSARKAPSRPTAGH